MPINGVALGALGIGSVFLYSAIKGKSVLATTQAIITGTNPKDLPQTNPITTNTSVTTGATGGTVPGNVGGIAGIGLSYVGKLRYVFGGPPPPGTVDCSSFVSKVLNQAGVKNPGGMAFNANTHGPNTLSYLAWNGAHTIGHSANVAQPGDLVVGLTHMGIATGNGMYVSAHSPSEGVKNNPISQFPDPTFSVRRIG